MLFSDVLVEILDMLFFTSLTLAMEKCFFVLIFIWLSLSICATKNNLEVSPCLITLLLLFICYSNREKHDLKFRAQVGSVFFYISLQ